MSTPATAPAEAVDPSLGDVAAGGVERAISYLEALPWEAHTTMLVLLAAGVLLWLWGGKLLKPTFGLLGVAIGGLAGMMVPPAIGVEQIGEAPGWLVGLGIGALVGLVVSLVLLKIAITFTAGVSFAVAGFMGGLVYLQYAPEPAPTTVETEGLVETFTPRSFVQTLSVPNLAPGERRREYLNPLTNEFVSIEDLLGMNAGDGSAEEAEGSEGTTAEDQIALAAAQVRAVLTEAWAYVSARWAEITVRERVTLLASTAIAFAVGLLAGLVLPKRSSAVVTAMLGAGIVLLAGVWLIQGVGFLEPARGVIADRSPTVWSVVWGITAAIGFAAQVGGLAKSGGKKTSSDDDGED